MLDISPTASLAFFAARPPSVMDATVAKRSLAYNALTPKAMLVIPSKADPRTLSLIALTSPGILDLISLLIILS